MLADDGRRSRLTVFFRLLLVLPHVFWLSLWSVAVIVAALAAWVAGLVLGRVPQGLHRFLASFVRYSAHVSAYTYLVGNPFPGFTGTAGTYPVDVEIAEPEPQRRLGIFLRGLLALPALLIATVLSYALGAVGLLGWFAALVTGRMPAGLRDLGAYVVRYTAQMYGYAALVTSTYPDSSPRLDDPSPAPVS